MSPYGYLDTCPDCGSERGPGGHTCVTPDARFAEFMPSVPLYPPPRQMTREELDIEVERRLIELRAISPPPEELND